MVLAVVALRRLTAPACMVALAASARAVSIMGRDQQRELQRTYIATFGSSTSKVCDKLDNFNHFWDLEILEPIDHWVYHRAR